MASGQPESGRAELRVGAHVLVQLGAELVTDAEQALLECVKNAYDADAPGCRVVIDTRSSGELVDRLPAAVALKFSRPSENVSVRLEGGDGEVVDVPRVPPDAVVSRTLSYQGSVVVEDNGVGISYDGLGRSWLVVSGSAKRVTGGPKARTPRGRTPLGDKGLGRLGTMKLGDILLVESATAPDAELSYAWFRWGDCESAATVDEVPVAIGRSPNTEGFKGTRVSVLGLRDIAEWRRPARLAELTRSMARLISPFEVASAFPVSLVLDQREQALAMVTDELLNQAVASFSFDWRVDAQGASTLHATARIGRRLFISGRTGELKQRTAEVFGRDGGRAFASHLEKHRRFRNYDGVCADVDGRWFIEVSKEVSGTDVLGQDLSSQPGPFTGAFYYYFFIPDPDGAPDEQAGTGTSAVIGAKASLQIVRDLAGVAILRDGFQVRNNGDWLDLSAGMTTGSTYNMRPENTIGYFALTGAENWVLREKSDREGFVDDAAYRAFLAIARYCRDFANNALVAARRTLDEYFKEVRGPARVDAGGAAKQLGEAGAAIRRIGDLGDQLGALLAEGVGDGDAMASAPLRRERAMALAAQVISAARAATGEVEPTELVRVIEDEVSEARARNVVLVESAAVGQAARGMVHELRTHLEEIRFRAGAIERDRSGKNLKDNVVSIRRSCSAIGAAAAEVDPMLPRSRALKDRLDLRRLVDDYFSARTDRFVEAAVSQVVSGDGTRVRMNRARLLQVIDNLTRNSIYWLERGPREDRRLTVEIGPTGFVFSDTGPGVDPVVEETLLTFS